MAHARFVLVGGFFLLASLTAHAALVEWTLSGVTFTDGGTASGSFVYDATTQTETQFDITTTAGSALPGREYIDNGTQPPYPALGFAVLDILNPANLTNAPFIAFSFSAALSDLGGTISLTTSSGEGSCSDAACNFGNYLRHVNGGSLIGVQLATAPEPPTILLAALALGAFWIRRRTECRR